MTTLAPTPDTRAAEASAVGRSGSMLSQLKSLLPRSVGAALADAFLSQPGSAMETPRQHPPSPWKPL